MALSELEIEACRLQGSLLEFIKTFYFLRNGRKFEVRNVIGRESHVLTVCRELVSLFRLETSNLIVNIPPGCGKSTLLTYFVSWAYAHYHDCQFIYISYSSELAETHTAEIKAIMQLPLFHRLFKCRIDPTSSARGDFRVIHDTKPGSGRTVAKGSAGSITGLNAGLQTALDSKGNPRFSGLPIMDDLHKPDEVHSDVRRESVIRNYNETIKMRKRSTYVGSVLLGQRLHEGDICQFIIDGKDGQNWRHVILPGLDEAENALAPHIISREQLLIEREVNPYTFWAQQQQNPQPTGGSLFRKDWFKILYEEPEFLSTFVTVDSAESQKQYADYTAMSFWGIYPVKFNNTIVQGKYAIHCIDAIQMRIEPKDLQREFFDFWNNCLRHKKQPNMAAIEKKSSGTGLISSLSEIPGIRILNIERSGISGSKTDRFIECQRYVGDGHVSILSNGKHTEMFLSHMAKITANNTHRYDDLADTMADAIKIALIDKLVVSMHTNSVEYDVLSREFGASNNRYERLRTGLYGKQ
jgi:predicted phage terminase large subunit-like protein